MRTYLFFVLPVFLFAGCLGEQDHADLPLLQPPPFGDSNPDGFWRTIDVAETGLSKDALQRHIKLCMDTGIRSGSSIC